MLDTTHWRNVFMLRKDLTFLNFGSFGACPQPIFDVYQEFQRETEAEPVEFFLKKGPLYLKRSREALGLFLNCQADDIVCVTNPSYAVNIVAKNLRLLPGDEILATNIEYGACDRTWRHYCSLSGAKYIRHPTTLPLVSEAAFVDEFMQGVTSRTKLIFISHITSTTALILPVDAICKAAARLNIPVFVDGAHTPGHIPLDLSAMNPAFYTGALHKWALCPKGASFLYASKVHQIWLDPLVVSWGYESDTPSGSQFLDYHETQGTRDLSSFCAVPAALDFMKQNQWTIVSQNCHTLALQNAASFFELCGSAPLAPLNDTFYGQMVAAEIQTRNPMELHELLVNQYHIQIPVMPQDDRVYLRYSINAFNGQDDLDRLFDACKNLALKGKIGQ